MDTIKNRLAEIMALSGKRQTDIAHDLGIPKSAISQYLSGKSTQMTSERVYQLSKYFGVSPAWLLGMSDEKNPVDIRKKVPILGTIAAGSPISAEENIIGYTYTDNHRISYALKVRGDSMIGSRIFDGDVVYVQTDTDYANGDIVVALVGEEATIKKYYRYGEEIVLQPTNPTMSEMRYKAEEVILEGKVIGVSFEI